jgi:hypothetical protein
MNKYHKLSRYLQGLDADEWDATFEEIEGILGFELPKSAREYNPWWANQSGGGHVQSRAWQSVGWRTEAVRPMAGTVRFVRSEYKSGRPLVNEEDQNSLAADQERNGVQLGLTIAEAKAGLALQFGVQEDQIEILIKG